MPRFGSSTHDVQLGKLTYVIDFAGPRSSSHRQRIETAERARGRRSHRGSRLTLRIRLEGGVDLVAAGHRFAALSATSRSHDSIQFRSTLARSFLRAKFLLWVISCPWGVKPSGICR